MNLSKFFLENYFMENWHSEQIIYCVLSITYIIYALRNIMKELLCLLLITELVFLVPEQFKVNKSKSISPICPK